MIEPEIWAGGCQCGTVRYRFTEKPTGAHVCHCRMCQKAVGNFYASFVGGPASSFEVTRGEIAVFRSSDLTGRGFCRDCGTPLTVFDVADTYMAVTIGSLDHPEHFPPIDQHGVESRYPFVNGIGHLPDQPPTEIKDKQTAAAIKASNRQHPDRDTVAWPNELGR